MKKRLPLLCALILAMILTASACADPNTNTSNDHENTIVTKNETPPSTTEPPAPSIEDRLTELFQSEPQAGLTLKDVTFFGTPIVGLTLEDAAVIARQNGFIAEIQQDENTLRYQASHPDNHNPDLHLSQFVGVDHLIISYFHSPPIGKFWGRDEANPPVWSGIREIYTFDTLDNVLSELNYTNSVQLAATIQEIFSLPSEEAIAILHRLEWCGFCGKTEGYAVDAHADRVIEWEFSWKDTDPLTQKEYIVVFRFLVKDNCLTAVTISAN